MMRPPSKDDGRFRAAVPEDAPALALFVNMAGEGLPHYLWSRMAAPGESAWEVGCARARRDAGSFSWRNATLRVVDGEAVACLIGNPLDDAPAVGDPASMPPMFQPLQQLEDQACGTWYVNVMVKEQWENPAREWVLMIKPLG